MIRSLIVLLLVTARLAWAGDSPSIMLLSDDSADAVDLFREKHVSVPTDTTNLVLRQIQNFEITIRIAPIARMDHLLKTEESACAINRVKNDEREAYSTYSLPVHLYPNHRFYYLAEETPVQSDMLNGDGQLINFAQLFKAYPKAQIGRVKNKSYGDDIDALFLTVNPQNIFERYGGAQYRAMIEMLVKKRHQFIIEYPTVVKEYYLLNPDQSISLSSLSIAGVRRYIHGYIACNTSPIGKSFIEEVNLALMKLYSTEEFKQAHTRYVRGEEDLDFDEQFKKVFQQRKAE